MPDEEQPKQQQYYTPRGGLRSLSAMRSRSIVSPNGRHCQPWWTGVAECNQQHQQARCDVEPWRQQQPSSTMQQLVPAQGLQQQQQHPLAQQQQLVLNDQAAQLVREVVRNEVAQLMKKEVAQQQPQQQEPTAAAGSSVAAAAGTVNPFGFLQPTIQQLPVTAAALAGAATIFSGGSSSSSSNTQAQLNAVVELVAVKTAGAIWRLQHQQQHSQAEAVMLPAPTSGRQGNKAAAALDAALDAEAAAAAAGAAAAMPQQPGAVGIQMPKMSGWTKFTMFDNWMDKTPQGSSISRRQMEANGDNNWWKQLNGDKRRVSDYRKLLAAIDAEAVRLTAKNQRVCSTAAAAKSLDEQCVAQGLNMCSYFTKHLKAKGKKQAGEDAEV